MTVALGVEQRRAQEEAAMNTDTIKPGEEFSQERTREIVEAFYRDGFAHIQ